MRIRPDVLFLCLALTGCQAPPVIDLQPPRLLDAGLSADGDELALNFDEPVSTVEAGGDFSAKPVLPGVAGARVSVPLPADLKPGKAYLWTAEVKDKGNNLTSLAGRFYGPNDHPARLRLNEIRIAGSGPHQDLVELEAETAGSLGGWTVEVWSSPTAKQKKILPDVTVEPGTLIVVHGKVTGDPGEQDERAPTDASGADTAPAAWDFWLADGKGFPGTKGLVVLRPAPDQPPVDGLLYASQPGDGAPLAAAAGWPGRDQLDPKGCTATRTWCRGEGPEADWVLVTTGAATPGQPNRIIPWEGVASSRKGTPRTKGRKNRLHSRPGPAKRYGPGSKTIPGPVGTVPGLRKAPWGQGG